MLNRSYFNSAEEYLKFYGLGCASVRYECVPFKSNGFELAGQVFVPKEYKATVVILHGYLGHCGLLAKIIRYLTGTGFAVAVYDLPGHGLSSGEPTAIDDFSQYTDSLVVFLTIARQKLHGPYHIIGHSMGAAIVMDYIFSGKKDYFDKVILAAPLIRSQLWFLSKLGYMIYRPFAKRIFRLFRNVSSDKDFLKFVKHKDPLQAKNLSLSWTGAMFKWNREIADAQVSDRPVMVIQGTCENIVSWRYNLKFIQSKFSNTQIKLVENVRHELFNESAEIREKVFSQIKDCLIKKFNNV
ncbi:MAG: alpha/beta hydrolase [Planctomycetes bacterium]|nr:alpha/beta hydrolase [Planctomycetota bacterium]MBU1518091.1 alpha/beta hydrolase [Planctomycetota bacterium]MBU2457793.1 alpha/beta hydrolase [Planctomycetota bacterium]